MLDKLPTWVGTAPQWGLFLAFAALLVKQIIPWRQQSFDNAAEFCKNLTVEVRRLTTELKECEAGCEAKTKALYEELWGMRKQHIQEQISLINTIMRSVDAPELQNMVALLEHVQRNLYLTQQQQQEKANVKPTDS